jgi:FMN phosphatase YigB (HAD superfamily)
VNVTRPPAPIRTILFDLGSTLWGPAEPATLAREEAAADALTGATLRELLAPDSSTWDDFTEGRAFRGRYFRTLMSAYAEQPLLEPDFAALALRVLEGMGYQPVQQGWGPMLYEAMRVRSVYARVVFADVPATLETLRGRGYALGIVTNRAYGGPIFLEDLRDMGLLRFFEPRHIAISADLGYRKPHPAIFMHALDGLGRAPEESAMVGDRLAADMLGAAELGMFTVWRPDRDETQVPDYITPDAVITEIADLLALFA